MFVSFNFSVSCLTWRFGDSCTEHELPFWKFRLFFFGTGDNSRLQFQCGLANISDDCSLQTWMKWLIVSIYGILL